MKKEFKILVEETLTRVVTVTANSEEEAYDKVKTDYHNEKVVLDYDDFSGVEFEIL